LVEQFRFSVSEKQFIFAHCRGCDSTGSTENSGNNEKTNDNANASVSLDLLSLTFVTHTQRGPINLGALALETGCV